MSEQIDEFCEGLRVKLTSIEKNVQALKAKIDAKAKSAEQDVRTYLDGLKKRVDQDRSKVDAAQKELKKWLDEYQAFTKEKIADWKATGERMKLRGRADIAEKYAKATAVIAAAAVDGNLKRGAALTLVAADVLRRADSRAERERDVAHHALVARRQVLKDLRLDHLLAARILHIDDG